LARIDLDARAFRQSPASPKRRLRPVTLALHLHPLASFCHKVLIALYENGTPFEARIVDLMDDEASRQFLDLWPVGKIPVLRDEANGRTFPETTIIIEYLQQHYPGTQLLLPSGEAERLETRLWDRLYDHYVQEPMQKIVTDRLRPEGAHDPFGVTHAKETLQTAYGMIERAMAERTWAAGEAFTLADCATAPALFHADIVAPFSKTHPRAGPYFERLERRPSFRRVLAEARPYFHLFPYKEAIPAWFTAGEAAT
jgi:glutathione S-transferase